MRPIGSEPLEMIAAIPAHQLVWMLNATRDSFAEKVVGLEMRIIQAERFRRGNKENPWDERSIIENAEQWIGQYAPLIRFLDALKKFVVQGDAEETAKGMAEFLRRKNGR
jgi:hypothetical protein